MITIEHVNEQTAPSARQIILDGLEEHFGSLNPSFNEDLMDICKSYNPNHFFIAMVQDGTSIEPNIVATGALVHEKSIMNEKYGRIVRMSVQKSWRRKGVGTSMLQHLCQVARELGMHCLVLETNLDWFDAIGFYKRFGFEETHRDEESTHMKLKL